MTNTSVKCVEEIAQSALTTSPIHAMRVLGVERAGDQLVISGRVDTFYHKQLAQELVRSVAEGVRVVNSINVD
mgnify:CR=1 FL=1|tara:strand:+ start:1028 stop:1246 length:219 start_codon:yes stop_codon:yes gene_type:complete